MGIKDIILNGVPTITILKTWDYWNVVNALPGNEPKDVKGLVYSITYSYPNHIDKRDGTLYPGGPSVEIVSGMMFDAYVTGNA